MQPPALPALPALPAPLLAVSLFARLFQLHPGTFTLDRACLA